MRTRVIGVLVLILVCCAANPVGCMGTSGWSPDSQQVILLMSDDEHQRLVIVDRDGRLVREVTRSKISAARFSPATWSPDGNWIAYVRIRKLDAPAVRHDDAAEASLIVQDAATGRDRTIGTWLTRPIRQGPAFHPHAVFGPQWLADSKSLALLSSTPEVPGVRVLDLQGRPVGKAVRLEQLALRHTPVFSPDNKWIGYAARKPDGKHVAVRLYDVARRRSREVAVVLPLWKNHEDAVHQYPRPAWSPDGRWVYFLATVPGREGENSTGLLQRVGVDGGKPETIWKRRNCPALVNIHVANKSGHVAINYGAIEVLNPKDGTATPIHVGSRDVFYLGMAISPDGRHVALTASGGRRNMIGAILSDKGARLRVFRPERSPKDLVAEFLEERLRGALKVAGAEEKLTAAKLDLKRIRSVYRARQAATCAVRAARGHTAPLLAEAADWAPLFVCLDILEHRHPWGREQLGDLARQEVAKLRKAYPKHPTLPGLEAKLDKLLTVKPPAGQSINALVVRVVLADLRRRLDAAGYVEQLAAVELKPDNLSTVWQAKKAAAVAARVAGADIELADWGPVAVYMEVIGSLPPDEREPFAAVARRRLAALLKAHPHDHNGPLLHDALDELAPPAKTP